MNFLIAAFCLFCLGNYFGLLLESFYSFHQIILLLAIVFALIALQRKMQKLLPGAVCLAMLFFGLWNGLRMGPSAEKILQPHWGKNVIVSGTVDPLTWKERDGLQNFVLKVKSLESGGQNLHYKKKIRVTLNAKENVLGKDLLLVGRLQEQVGFRNPGAFDSKTYYRVQEIGGRLARAKLIESKSNIDFFTRIAQLNFNLRKSLEDHLPNSSGKLLGGMLLGGSGLDDESREIFASNGLSHLLSVSGTHLVLLAGLLMVLLKPLPFGVQRLVIIFCLMLYAMLCGLKPPVLRALVMSGIVLYGGSGAERGRLLGLAAIILLVFKPAWILDVGFQLSFGASAGLIYLLPKLKTRLEEILPGLIAEGVSVTLSVQLTTLPIVINNFHQVSIISLISNVIFLPLLELASFLAALGLALLYLFQAQFVLKLSGFFLEQVLAQADFLRGLSFGTIPVAQLPAWSYGIYYGWLLLWLDGSLVKILSNRERKLSLHGLALIFLCACIWTNLWPRTWSTYFLDVGQGDCAVVVTPWRKIIVIDTGGLKNFDTGANILTPFLHSLGKKSVDYLILSHYDGDHVGGLQGFLRNISVQKIILPKEKVTEASLPMYEACKQSKALTFVAKEGMSFTLDGTELEILGAGDYEAKGNEASTVARVSYKGRSILFTGDMDAKREEEFARNPRADVLKVAHHGSKSSSTQGFISRVSPKLAIISVGRYNMYGHPHKNVLANLQAAGCKIFRTDEGGCIRIDFEDGKINVN